jgi:hypothetical protein
MWEDTRIHPLGHAALLALIESRIPAVRIDDFATDAERRQLLEGLLGHACRTSSIKQVTRLGISQYEQGLRATKEGYFAQARQLDKDFSRIFTQSFPPLQRLIGKLGEAGFDADIMCEPGLGRYFAGNGKLRNGFSPIHVDFAAQDSAGWAIAAAKAQLAWNLYLRIPEQGGELLLWDKLWTPQDDVHKARDSYYYNDEVVRGAPMLTVSVRPGEVILINSRNYHAVTQAQDRLAFGSFISVFDDGRLRLWS